MPGVPKDKMLCFGYPNNNVYFGGLAPKEWEYDQEREYKRFLWTALWLLSNHKTWRQFEQWCAEDENVKGHDYILI